MEEFEVFILFLINKWSVLIFSFLSSFIIKLPKKSFPIELTNVADPPNLDMAIEALHAFPPVEKICFFEKI